MTTMSALEAALAAVEHRAPKAPLPTTGPGAQARARHAEYLADIERVTRQHKATIASAPGYNAAMGVFYCPADAVAFIDANIAADLATQAMERAA